MPKTVIQTRKTESKYQTNVNDYKQTNVPKTVYQTIKTETKYPIRNYDYKENLKDYNINTSSHIRDKPKIMYFARCPHCNFLLNDENEVKKYYGQISNNTTSNFYINCNQKNNPYDMK